MEFKKIILGLEEAIFQIAWWIIMIPYMLFLYCSRLPVMVRMVGIEIKKKKEDQFKNIVSPILFLILILILPFACFREIFPSDITIKFAGRAAYISIAALCFLLPTSFAHALETKGKLSKAKLHEAFLKQCYIQPPILLLIVGIILFKQYAPVKDQSSILLHSLGSHLLSAYL